MERTRTTKKKEEEEEGEKVCMWLGAVDDRREYC